MAKKTVWDTIAIVGVGLIGGSIGLALRKRKLARRVIGIGRNPASLRKAMVRQIVNESTTSLENGVADAELIVVCTPVGDVVERVQAIVRCCRHVALITDVGSTKSSIVSALDYHLHGKFPSGRGYFIGSHPIAGSEKSGPENAAADLFEGRNVIITPTSRTQEDKLARITEFWSSLGGRVSRMTPQAHDEALAAVSHLPHVVAAALAGATPKKHLPLAGTGWRDTTRIASGDINLWAEILSDNGKCTARALDDLITQLKAFQCAMECDSQAPLKKLLQEGKSSRDAVGN